MTDPLTIRKLYATGKYNDKALMSKIDVMGSRDRVLDKAPEKYTSLSSGADVKPFGVYMYFRRLYEYYKVERSGHNPKLVVDNREVACDFDVYIALRTLLDVGITRSAECAFACRHVFNTIVATETRDGITTQEVSKILRMSGDYYRNEIIQAVMDSVFSSDEQVKIKLRDALKKEDVDQEYWMLGSPEDEESFNKVVRKVYKQACTDQTYHVKKHLGRIVNVVNYMKEKGLTI